MVSGLVPVTSSGYGQPVPRYGKTPLPPSLPPSLHSPFGYQRN